MLQMHVENSSCRLLSLSRTYFISVEIGLMTILSSYSIVCVVRMARIQSICQTSKVTKYTNSKYIIDWSPRHLLMWLKTWISVASGRAIFRSVEAHRPDPFIDGIRSTVRSVLRCGSRLCLRRWFHWLELRSKTSENRLCSEVLKRHSVGRFRINEIVPFNSRPLLVSDQTSSLQLLHSTPLVTVIVRFAVISEDNLTTRETGLVLKRPAHLKNRIKKISEGLFFPRFLWNVFLLNAVIDSCYRGLIDWQLLWRWFDWLTVAIENVWYRA